MTRDYMIYDGEHRYLYELKARVIHKGKVHGGAWFAPKRGRPGRIQVVRSLGDFDFRTALRHELTHAAEYAESFSIPEASLEKIARYWTRLLDHTPWLIEMLTKDGMR